MKQVVIILIAVAALENQTIQADDWPQWRGTNRDGVWRETGILETFPPEGLKVLWRVACGAGLSSPVVASGRVYLTDVAPDPKLAKPQGQYSDPMKAPRLAATERIRCFDEATGQLLWSHDYVAQYYEWAFDPKSPNGPSCAPLVSDGRLFTRGAAGDLRCLDATSGRLIWNRNTSDDYGVAELSGTTPSPVIEGSLLIVMVGGKQGTSVVALDKNSGREVWHALSDKWTYSSPLLITAGGQRQLIGFTPEGVTSLDPATGHTWWREAFATMYADATPVVEGNRLLVDGALFELANDKPAAKLLWRQTFNSTCIPVLQGDCIFALKSTSRLVCLDSTTGKQLWDTDQCTARRSGACIHITPNKNSFLLFTEQGNLIRARLTRRGYEEMSRAHLIDPDYTFGGREVQWQCPAYANGHAFVRNDEELICASLEAKP